MPKKISKSTSSVKNKSNGLDYRGTHSTTTIDGNTRVTDSVTKNVHFPSDNRMAPIIKSETNRHTFTKYN
jgi:hypothetical protein